MAGNVYTSLLIATSSGDGALAVACYGEQFCIPDPKELRFTLLASASFLVLFGESDLFARRCSEDGGLCSLWNLAEIFIM